MAEEHLGILGHGEAVEMMELYCSDQKNQQQASGDRSYPNSQSPSGSQVGKGVHRELRRLTQAQK